VTPLFPSARVALYGLLVLSVASSPILGAQALPAAAPAVDPVPDHESNQTSGQTFMYDWAGLQVVRISYEGVREDLLKPLPTQLAQQADTPLDPDKVRESLRSLYATGLYQTIEVLGVRAGNDVSIIFSGTPRLFLGRVNVEGVKDDRLDAVLDAATQLQPGTAYSESKVAAAQPEIGAALQNNGFYRGQINQTKVLDRENSLVDLNFYTTTGPQARIGDVELTGDSGLTEVQFRKEAKLKRNSKVNRNTVTRALSSLRKHYNKRERSTCLPTTG
jgi:outer membrane protein insertion porin family